MARSRQRASRSNVPGSCLIVLDDDDDCQVADSDRRDVNNDCQVAAVFSSARPVREQAGLLHPDAAHQESAAAADLLELRLGIGPYAAVVRRAPLPPTKRRRVTAVDLAAPAGPAEDCQVLYEVVRNTGRPDRPHASSSLLYSLPVPLGFGKEAKPTAPARELSLTCAICLAAMKEESSTVCGHIFCRSCIMEAVMAQKRCPTCRRKLAPAQIHRIYLASSAG